MASQAYQIPDQEAEIEALRAELTLYRKALDQMHQGLCMFDPDGRIVVVNCRYAEVLGLDPDEVRPGMTGRELLERSVAAGRHPGKTVSEVEEELWTQLGVGGRLLFSNGGETHQLRHTLTPDRYLIATSEDVSTQVAAETALQESEEHYRLTVELNPQIPWTTNPDGIPQTVSPRLVRLTGIPMEVLASNRWSELVHPEDRASLGEIWSACMRSGEPLESRARFRMRDRSWRWFRTRAAPKWSETGEIVRWYGLCEDVHEQVQLEERLRQGETQFRAIIDAIPNCVKIFDADGQLVHINPCGLELLQAPSIASVSTPGYEAIVSEYMPLCRETHARVLAGEAVTWSFKLVGLKGRQRHVEAQSVPFRMADGSKAHLCISRDVTEKKEAEEALRRSEERLRLLYETTGLADFETRPDGISTCSELFFRQVGLPVDKKTMTAEESLQLVHPLDQKRIKAEVLQGLKETDGYECEFRMIRADTGETRWIASRTKVVRDENGEMIRAIGAHLDITDRKRAEEALRESEERFRLAAEAAGLGIWDYDAATQSRNWSGRLREILGISDTVRPSRAAALERVHQDDRDVFTQLLQKTLESRKAMKLESSVRISRASDGAERWVTMNGWKTRDAGRDMGRIIVTFRDVTDEKTAEERIRWIASHDALTGLANRRLLQDKLDEAIRHAADAGECLGLLLLDLDHFKKINDTHGHDAGDELLKMLACRLQSTVREGDTVARLGGDEFALILPGVGSEENLSRLSRSILDRLQEPFVCKGHVLHCRASVGATVFPKFGADAETLLKSADIALYAAKSNGRATSALFAPQMETAILQRGAMLQLARDALRDNRVVPYYQPKLGLLNRSIVGFEALLRWRTPYGELNYPASIEAAFEDADLAAAISDRIIERTISDMRSWLDQGIEFHHVAVNASAAEFRNDKFAERVLDRLAKADIPPHHFQLEVTESVFLGPGAEYVHRSLAQLGNAGVRVALDDFGTGYASLAHLKKFPVDTIKIDRSFVQGIESDTDNDAIIRAVIHLGRSLGIKVVAEGIETDAQAACLLKASCDFGQGFLFSKAEPANRVPELVRRFTQLS
ncbi:EAL domain-containing protein [Altericroceibacterium xinjiangense]|uniref:EAL domain-containing protein n=1 Tax=Altericroceibacterium xinjiangense TaxID=762261 RepID=UPI000F7D81B7|nr:EAL domain-containing protein [Altericroceibacterium xinjiangense]